MNGAGGTPDLAFSSDLVTGVWVYDSIPMKGLGGPGTWWIVGGTSLASPSLAGIVNAAGHFSASTSKELQTAFTLRFFGYWPCRG